MQQPYEYGSYRPATNLSLFAVIGLSLSAVSAFLSIIVGIGQVLNPDNAMDLGDGEATSLWLMLQGLVYLLLFPISIATIVGFLMWLYRAHSNLQALRPTNLEFTPGWAVGWWFIPFANLVKPFQVVREVWWESDPDVPDEHSFLSVSLHSAPTYMGFWWAAWIASNILSNITSRVYDPDTMDTVAIGGALFIITGIVTIIAAILAIRVVRDVTSRQEQRFRAVGMMTQNVPPPPPVFGGHETVYGSQN
jgi:uncharacterized protein YjeT (DUF2065 family)